MRKEDMEIIDLQERMDRSVSIDNKITKHELKQTRKNLGLSVKESAKTFKVSYSCWGKWERGERPIPGLLTVALELYKQTGKP